MQNLGKAVRKIRMDKEMSIEDLAKSTGLSETYLYGLETQISPMFSDEILSKLCEAFRVNKAALITASMSEEDLLCKKSDFLFWQNIEIFGGIASMSKESDFVGYLAGGDYQAVSQQIVQTVGFEKTEPIIIQNEPK